MQLNLKYNEHASYALSGAFIRGNSPAIWLHQLDAWKIPLHSLLCFIIAQNNQPHQAAGLFVIFKQGHLPNLLQVMHPYRAVAGKLFLPIDAELTPEVTEHELKSLLIWDYQVFHPAHGFIGFEKTDRISLTDLLQYPDPNPVSWEYANPGQPAWIRLHEIRVLPPSVEDLFESIKEFVSSKPLEDIPYANEEKDSSVKDLTNAIRRAVLKGGLNTLKALMAFSEGNKGFGEQAQELNKMLTGKSTGGTLPHKAAEQRLLKRLVEWMQQRLEDLQKQRQSELKRLSDLFDTNTDEALQYAIPLSSPYFNRGEAEPSARLTKRLTDFNVNQLGGGGPVDGWNVDNYYNDLRSKYIKAAEKALEANDHKKAAYIYAHLLGDYSAAAYVLKQGNYFREAAVLYKDHLKNIPAAAECLEKGGLLLEAIEIYTSLNKYEKAGDLYTILNQQEAAIQCYEQCAEQAAVNRDYLDEARILAEKIGDRPRAKKELLKGWKDVKYPEGCLIKYFDLVAEENREQVSREVEAFYQARNHTNNELSFLTVLNKVSKKYKTEELDHTCKTIAYEVVSGQVSEGNAASLRMLSDFIPGDRLLAPDCHRFIIGFKHTPKVKAGVTQIQLLKNTVWKHAITLWNQLLVWGTMPSYLYLARISGEGHIEYYSWNIAQGDDISFLAVANYRYSNNIVLLSNKVLLTHRPLPVNNYFHNELSVEQPVWFPANLVGVAITKNGIGTLHSEKNGTFLNLYASGTLKSSHRCMIDKDTPFHTHERQREMIFIEGYYYLSIHNSVFVISEEGQVQRIPVDANIRSMTAIVTEESLQMDAFTITDDYLQLALSTDRGCVVLYSLPGVAKPSIGKFFAAETEVTDIKFISATYLAVAASHKVYIYQLSKLEAIELCCTIETEFEIVAVFQAANRNQVGILEKNGQITIHSISVE
jgi:tetratricopeptide (TPR) repeat protein